MEKILDAIADVVADKVLAKLWETERMKNFLAGKKAEVHVDDVTGLTQFIKRTVNDAVEVEMAGRTVDTDNVEGLERYVEDIAEEKAKEIAKDMIDNATFTVSAEA